MKRAAMVADETESGAERPITRVTGHERNPRRIKQNWPMSADIS